MTRKAHDSLFRAAFSTPARAAALLRRVLPAPLVRRIRWNTLHREDGSFVDRHLEAHITDLLFRVEVDRPSDSRRRGRNKQGPVEVFIYLLIEHQSAVDVDMPLRMLDYFVRICKDVRQRCPAGELPLVVPVVISNAAGGWTGPRCCDDLFACSVTEFGDLAKHVPRFELLLFDLAEIPDDELRALELDLFAKLSLWFLRDARNGDAILSSLSQWGTEFTKLAQGEHGFDQTSALITYAFAVSDGMKFAKFITALRKHVPDTEHNAMTIAEELIQKGREEGFTSGRQEGRLEGLQEGLVQTLAAILERRFGPLTAAQTQRLANASTDELGVLADRVLHAESTDEVLAAVAP